MRLQSSTQLKLNSKAAKIIKQNEAVASKHFSFDTYSWDQKKRGANDYSQFQIHSSFQNNTNKNRLSEIQKKYGFDPYQQK